MIVGAIADVLPESPNRLLHLIVPKTDVTIDDTWFTLGLTRHRFQRRGGDRRVRT
ncbi:MAG: hypothetical protein R2710_18890 [Acidimicrobiales bacterium]